MIGLHLTADLGAVDAALPAMTQADALRALCVAAVRESGLQPVGELFHSFPTAPGASAAGVTGVVLLAESHLAVHTWPEVGRVTLDVFVCNQSTDNSGRAQRLLDELLRAFRPGESLLQRLQRGALRD
ncbi:MAG: adenosylmethionine decarboxylase [Roseateles sp.]|nr:MAG: adenosylmethionine decarboxylase [Roseateles sp.]